MRMNGVGIQELVHRRFAPLFALCTSCSLFLILLLLRPGVVLAHARSISYSTWEISGSQAQVTVRVPVIELHRAGLSFAGAVTAEPSAEYLTTHLRLFSGNRFCAPIAPGAHLIPTTDPTRRVWTWTVRCSSAQSLRLHNDAFFIFAPAHLHFARVHVAGSPIREKNLSFQEQE